MVISNVPGPAETRYLDGSRLDEIYPVSLLFNGQALNITAVSYDGEFNIGFTGCRDSIPSLQRIAVHAGEELDALEAALDRRSRSARRHRAPGGLPGGDPAPELDDVGEAVADEVGHRGR